MDKKKIIETANLAKLDIRDDELERLELELNNILDRINLPVLDCEVKFFEGRSGFREDTVSEKTIGRDKYLVEEK